MTRDPSVLDGNLRALLARAYAPVTPPEAFRERVRSRCLALIPEPARPRRVGLLVLGGAIAIAAALALLLWWPSRERAETAAQILARGLVAVRVVEGGPWQASQSGQVRLASSYLELITGARGARAEVADTGSLALAPESALVVRAAARELVLQLDRGALAVERSQSPESWRVTTADGDVEIERGSLSVAHRAAGGVLLTLRSGTAWVPAAGRRHDLTAGVEVVLRGGEVIEQPSATAAAGADEPRRTLPPGTGPGEATAAASPASAVAVDGQVKDAVTLAPLANFQVTLLREQPLPRIAEVIARELENAGGEFTLDGLEPGVYSVFVQAEDYAVWSARHVVLAPEAPVEIEAALVRGSRIRGYVVDTATQRPLAGALVVSETDTPAQLLPVANDGIPDGFTAAALTLPNGSFELDHLSPGPHILRASASGHAPSWSGPVTVATSGDLDGVLFQLGAGGGIRGTITGDDAAPRTGVVVVASLIDGSGQHFCMTYGLTATDAAGQFALGDLAAGDYSVVNLGEGGRDRLQPHVVAAHVVAGQITTVDFSGRLSGARLHGRLRNARGEVDGYSVAVMPVGCEDRMNGWRGVAVGANGRYELTGLPAGRYHVSAGRGMGPSQTLQGEVELLPGADREYDIELASGEIQGRVREAEGGAPVATPVLVLERLGTDGAPDQFAAISYGDSEGRYVFAGVRAGIYRLTCYAMRGGLGQETTENVRVTERDPERTIDFDLSPGGALRIAVIDAQGHAAVGAHVQFTDERGRQLQMSAADLTDAAGKLVVNGIKPGRWHIAAQEAGEKSQVREVTVRAGETIEVALTLAP